jgi:myo-inositol-1(or 4)-monophosphatase
LPEADAADLSLITDAARQGGAIAKTFFGGTYKRWDKARGEPVTEADIAVNSYLRERLTQARPDYGWLSEESVDNEARVTTLRTFVVDPIDGTIAFLKGKPHFTISIAVVEHGRPVSAVVFNPITEECFCASKGFGATLDGVALRVSGRQTLEGCRMLSAKSLFEHPIWSKPPNRPWPEMHIEQRNSLAYRLALVGAGQFDATLALSSKHDWDLAAGDLIVQEAGGRVTDIKGDLLRYNSPVPVQRSMVGAGEPLHALLLERVRHLALPER